MSDDALKAALGRLYKTLDIALARNVHENSRARDRYVLALSGIVKFLDETESPREFQDIFVGLMLAMMDLDEGRVDPALKQTPKQKGGQRKGGRPNDPASWWLIRARLCVAVELLHATGMSIDEAIDQLLEDHPVAVAKVARTGKPKRRTVRDWYDVLSLSGNDDLAHYYFRKHSAKLRADMFLMPQTERLKFALSTMDILAHRVFPV